MITKKNIKLIVEQEIGKYLGGDNNRYHIPAKHVESIKKAIKQLVGDMQPLDNDKLFSITYAISLITSELTTMNYDVSTPKLAKQIGRIFVDKVVGD